MSAQKTTTKRPSHPSVHAILHDAIDRFLSERPAFFSLIRPQEIALFHRYADLFQAPILDFGCGDGFFARAMLDAGRSTPDDQSDKTPPLSASFAHLPTKTPIDEGVDVPSSLIDEAGPSGVYANRTSYDGVTLPYPDRSYQSVFANCVLEHIPEVPQSVSEIARVLKPGGHFLTGVMTDQWETFMLGPQFFGDYYRRKMRVQQDHYSLHSVATWRSIFEDAGLEIVAEIGYVNPRTARLLDLAHYCSIPSLVSRALTGNWAFWQNWHRPFGHDTGLVDWLTSIDAATLDCETDTSSAVFFVLQKNG